MKRRIDFNCDLGEGCGDDAAIVPWISSASIACGAHAGDEATMRATVRLCHAHGVAIGAHPGYADRAHFGRHEVAMASDQIRQLVGEQVRRLAAIAADEGARLAHVKPHGALYNLAARDRGVAEAIAHAVAGVDSGLRLFGLAGSQLTAAAEAARLQAVHEVFAERGYDADGRLVPRGTPGAVIDDLDEALAQVRTMLREEVVVARDGTRVPIRADTVCLHGDRADAPAFARALRAALEAEGVQVRAPGDAE